MERNPVCRVTTATQSYPIYVGWDIFPELGRMLVNAGIGGSVHLVSDDNVYGHYGALVEGIIVDAGHPLQRITVPPGEATKSLETAGMMYDLLAERRAERGDAVLALGGGMIGDLAGFVAATYLRGLPLVHLPTSLLAMVDASVGGKVAVNLASAKNLVGAFYQPRLVVADVSTLKTLPRRELISGYTEVIKHALILDEELFGSLENEVDSLLALEPDKIEQVVARSVAIKAAVVSEDEREEGKRIILNYGHTIGHAIEAVSRYEGWLHGEAVAVGMMGAARISQRLGLVSEDVVQRQGEMLERFGLPLSCPGLNAGDILEAMTLDKKVRSESIRWVLLDRIGNTVIRDDVPLDMVRDVLGTLLEER
jgi:3-dehydroquinate synthase